MTTPPSPRDPMFGRQPLPDWVKSFRPVQWGVIEEVVEAFKTNDVVFLQAPTGTGKTLIGETVRRRLETNGVYTCSTKALQDQFSRDFPYAKVLKGRSNYLTELGLVNEYGNPLTHPPSEITCADCTYDSESGVCDWCSTRSLCPYIEARSEAERNPLAVLNTSYFLTSNNFTDSPFGNRGLVVFDECDVLEQELMNFVQLDISPRMMKNLGIKPPRRKTIESEWWRWLTQDALPAAEQYLADQQDARRPGNVRDARRVKSAENLLSELQHLHEELPNGGWVYDPSTMRGEDDIRVTFKPVKVTRYGPRYLWPHGQKFLLMSASILSHHAMAEELGVNTNYTMVNVPGGYPVENRPVNFVPISDNTLANRDNAWPQIARACAGVLNKHPDERILIHTVSYDFAGYISEYLRDNTDDRMVITYRNSEGKAAALEHYLEEPGAVMVAASMDRGIDLPGDACRVQVIAKVPWPFMGDRRIKQRANMKGGQEWYNLQAIRSMVQMTGRGVRSSSDTCTTYIFDAQFARFDPKVFPPWWAEAVTRKIPKRAILRLAK